MICEVGDIHRCQGRCRLLVERAGHGHRRPCGLSRQRRRQAAGSSQRIARQRLYGRRPRMIGNISARSMSANRARSCFELGDRCAGHAGRRDEATLGTRLFVPDRDLPRIDELTVLLPQILNAREPRVIYRDLPFVHRFHTPDDADGSVFVLLHGSGANETSVMPLAHKIDPRATLLGVRGRAVEEECRDGSAASRPSLSTKADIIAEAQAFAAFIEGAASAYDLDPARIVYIGYSNGVQSHQRHALTASAFDPAGRAFCAPCRS